MRTLVYICAIMIGFTASAHERFMVPTHTVLSGDAPQVVTVSASISNDLFHPDRPFGDNFNSDTVGELAPLFNVLSSQHQHQNGEIKAGPNWRAFARMSVADWQINEAGTHRLTLLQPLIPFTTFKTVKGDYGRRFGPNPELPEGITDVVKRASTSRVETFLSLNDLTAEATKPQGTGLEITGQTHPNDLFAQESAVFQLFFDGQPIAGKVKIIAAGTRHRNDRGETLLTTDALGHFKFTPEKPGFYLLVADHAVEQPKDAERDVVHYGLMLTLEVFP